MTSFCVQCGKELGPEARYCSVCGTRNAAAFAATLPAATRLVRPRSGRMIAGVCAGLALSYGWDLVWVRVIAVLAAVFSSGAGGIAYIVFWVVMPEEPLYLAAPPEYYQGTAGAGASAAASTPYTDPLPGSGAQK